jgi:hypothetical protein
MAIHSSGTSYVSYTVSGAPSATIFTVTFWGKITTDNNDFSTFFSIDRVSNDYFVIQTLADGVTPFAERNDGDGPYDNTASWASALTVGTWYFFAGVLNGTTVKLYIADPTQALTSVSNTLAGSPTAAWATIAMGNIATDTTAELTGDTAALKLWDGVELTQAEIEQERWTYLPQRRTNLYMCVPMFSNATANLIDISGNGKNLITQGTPGTADGPPITWGHKVPRYIIKSSAAPASFYLNDSMSIPSPKPKRYVSI